MISSCVHFHAYESGAATSNNHNVDNTFEPSLNFKTNEWKEKKSASFGWDIASANN